MEVAPEPGLTLAKREKSSLVKAVEEAMLVAEARNETQVCLAPAVGPCFFSELSHEGTFWWCALFLRRVSLLGNDRSNL